MDNTSALNSFKMALEVDPSYALAAFNAANLYYSHRRWDQAIEFYNRVKIIEKKEGGRLGERV